MIRIVNETVVSFDSRLASYGREDATLAKAEAEDLATPFDERNNCWQVQE